MTTYKVGGKVTMAGAPLAGAIVTFAPKDGQPVAIAQTDNAGAYSLTTYDDDPGGGAAKGSYAVTVAKFLAVAAPAEAAHSADPYSESDSGGMHGGGGKKGADGTGNVVPPQYSDPQKTPLTFTVESKDQNQFDIEIK